MRPGWALALIAGFAGAPAAAEEVPVDLELVLAVDVSSSVDSVEARLQRKGYVDALKSPEILGAIQNGTLGRIAVTYVEWSGSRSHKVVAPWTLLDNKASAFAFATFVEASPRGSGHWTSIGGALDFAWPLFDDNGFQGTRRAIDISADGPNNDGPSPDKIRDLVIEKGITINGLPIVNSRTQASGLPQMPNYDHYFEDCVIGGRGAFLVIADDYGDFARAIKRKLLFEIADLQPPPAARSLFHRASSHDRSDCERSWDYRRREDGIPAP